jgi:hypothetical protein
VAINGLAKGVLTAALCPLPLVAVRVAAGPEVFVRLKLAEAEAPGAEAVTE